MREKPLTAAEESFCRAYVFPAPDGSSTSLTDAYLVAFGMQDRRSATRKAAWLMRRKRIEACISELRNDAERVLSEQLTYAGITQRAWRLLRKNRDWQRLSDLLASRAAKESKVPGHETGLLVASPKFIGGEKVIEYRFDKAILDALLELEESAAKELGRLTGKEGAAEQVVIYLPENGRG